MVRPVGHFASGVVIGGYGGGDIVPAMLEPGEAVLTKETVQNIGVNNINSLNAPTSAAGAGQAANDVYVAVPIKIMLPGQRMLTETVVHTAAKRAALSGGGYVSG